MSKHEILTDVIRAVSEDYLVALNKMRYDGDYEFLDPRDIPDMQTVYSLIGGGFSGYMPKTAGASNPFEGDVYFGNNSIRELHSIISEDSGIESYYKPVEESPVFGPPHNNLVTTDSTGAFSGLFQGQYNTIMASHNATSSKRARITVSRGDDYDAEPSIELHTSSGGRVDINGGTNINTYIGRSVIHGTSTAFYISNAAIGSTTTYSWSQNESGATFINSLSGQSTSFRINNTEIANLSSTYFTLPNVGSAIRTPSLHILDSNGSTWRETLKAGISTSVLSFGSEWNSLNTSNINSWTLGTNPIFNLTGNVTGDGFKISRSSALSNTSGNGRQLGVSVSYTPTSGNANYMSLYDISTINQTGTASGSIYSIYISPTINSLIGAYCAIYTNVSSTVTGGGVAYAQYHNGTGKSYLGGQTNVNSDVVVLDDSKGLILKQGSDYYRVQLDGSQNVVATLVPGFTP